MIDPDSVSKVSEATKALAEAGGKAIEATRGLGRIIKGPIEEGVGIVWDRIKFVRWKAGLALTEKAEAIMAEKGLKMPTRELPSSFAAPLLSHALLEEDDELQETWARLLVNAGDAATEMDLRTAYVDILAGMSAFDVKNLSVLATATPLGSHYPSLETWDLPKSAKLQSLEGGLVELDQNLAVSLGNLARLGCIDVSSSPIFMQHVRVTPLGMALYKACS